MEPLSIATAVGSLISNLGSTIVKIHSFVGQVRDARKDLDRVSRELDALQASLHGLRDEDLAAAIVVPRDFNRRFESVLGGCETSRAAIEALLVKYQQEKLLRRIQWAAWGSDKVEKLRSNLESHKLSLNLQLSLLNLWGLCWL